MPDARVRIARVLRNITAAEFQAAQDEAEAKEREAKAERPPKRAKTARVRSDRSSFEAWELQSPLSSREEVEEWYKKFPCVRFSLFLFSSPVRVLC
jgi:hypothetical protein